MFVANLNKLFISSQACNRTAVYQAQSRRLMDSVASGDTFRQVVLAPGQREYFQQLRAVSCWRRILQHRREYEHMLMSKRETIAKSKLRSHFKAWLSVRLRKLTVSSWQQRRQASTLNCHLIAWRMCAIRSAMLRAMYHSIRTGMLRSWFQEWKHVAGVWKQKQHAAMQLLRILRLTALRMSFRLLQKRVYSSHKSKTLAILGGHFQSNRIPIHVVRRWRAQARRLVATRDILVGRSAHRRMQTLQHVFEALNKRALVRKEARAHDFLAYAHHTSKSLRRAWDGLKLAILMYRSEQPLLVACRQYLRVWRNTVAAEKVSAQAKLRATCHYRSTSFRRSFDAWCEFSRQQRVKADKNLLALMFRRMALQQGCLTNWFRRVQQQKRLNAFGARLWKVTSVVRLNTTLDAWKRFFWDRRELHIATNHNVNRIYRVVFAAFAQQVKRRKLARQGALTRMHSVLLVRLASCVRWWRLLAVRKARTRSSEKLFRQSLVFKHKCAVLASWKQYTKIHQRLQHTEVVVARRVRAGRLSRIFASWQRLADVTVTRSTAARALRLFRYRLLLQRWAHAVELRITCRRVWSRLNAHIEERLHSERKLTAFKMWKDNVAAEHTISVLERAATQRYRYTLLCKGLRGLDEFRQGRISDRQKLAALQRRCDINRASAAWSQLVVVHRAFVVETARSAHAYGHRAMRMQRECFTAWRQWLDHRKQLLYTLSLPNGISESTRFSRNLYALLSLPREASPSYDTAMEEPTVDPLSMALADVDSATAALHVASSAIIAECASADAPRGDTHSPTVAHLEGHGSHQLQKSRRPQPRALDMKLGDQVDAHAETVNNRGVAAIPSHHHVSAAACPTHTTSMMVVPQPPVRTPPEPARVECDDDRMSPATFLECEAQVAYWQAQVGEATNRERELAECDSRIQVLQQLLCARDAVPALEDGSSLLFHDTLVRLQTYREALLQEQLKWTKLWHMMEPRVFHRQIQLERCRKYLKS